MTDRGTNTLAARGLEELFFQLTYKNSDQYLSSCMSHKNNTVIDVTSLFALWNCRINHNISTRMQSYLMHALTDTLIWCGLGNLIGSSRYMGTVSAICQERFEKRYYGRWLATMEMSALLLQYRLHHLQHT